MQIETSEVMEQQKFNDDHFQYLTSVIDELCLQIAEKYGLNDSRGRPRKAFIIDTLIKHPCLGCISKIFRQPQISSNIDNLFLQNHELAVNLLIEQLRQSINQSNLLVEGEVNGEYGRPDVIVKPSNAAVIIQIGKQLEIIVEVKTGTSFSYAQLFRYLIERPNAILILWRVALHQNIVIRGDDVRDLLIMIMETALNRGRDLLNYAYEECIHNPVNSKPYIVKDAQAIIDNILPALPRAIQSVTNTVLALIETINKNATANAKLQNH